MLSDWLTKDFNQINEKWEVLDYEFVLIFIPHKQPLCILKHYRSASANSMVLFKSGVLKMSFCI